MMKIQITSLNNCKQKHDTVYCPDLIMRQLNNGKYGIPIHDGGDSVIVIKFCPWCGKHLNKE